MLSTAQLIPYLYPSATPGDFELHDEGSGVFIAKWDSAKLGPQPTVAQLEARRSEVPDPPLAQRNEATIEAELGSALANLRSYLANPNPTASQDKQVIKLMARVCLQLTRRSLRDYKGTD